MVRSVLNVVVILKAEFTEILARFIGMVLLMQLVMVNVNQPAVPHQCAMNIPALRGGYRAGALLVIGVRVQLVVLAVQIQINQLLITNLVQLVIITVQ